MSQVLREFVEGLKIGEGRSHGDLTIFPVFCEPHAGPDYLLLSNALEQNLIEITETSRAGTVPELKLVNRSERMVLIIDGEELVGAKQNRIVNTTILVGTESELVIPVTCVEQGRWDYRSPSFSSGAHFGPVFLRAEKARQVQSALKLSQGYTSDQVGIWQSIAGRFRRSSSSSPTNAMSQLYESAGRRLRDFVRHLRCSENQCGSIAAIGRRISGMDVFGNAFTYQQLHHRLIESYAMDAIDLPASAAGRPPARKMAQGFLRDIAGSRFEDRAGVGLGTDTRIEGKGISGFALRLGECALHLAVFRVPEDGGERLGLRLAGLFQRMSGRR